MTSPLLAAKAYAAVLSNAQAGQGAGAAAAAPGFGELLNTVVSDMTQAARAAETQTAAHLQGKAELVDVVTAVAGAEASLEAVVAVRDQVIQAYQEIMRMPI